MNRPHRPRRRERRARASVAHAAADTQPIPVPIAATTGTTAHPHVRDRDRARSRDRYRDDDSGGSDLVGGFTPAEILVGGRHLCADDAHIAVLIVVGYPRDVGPAWLDPLLTFPGRVDVSLHVDPLDPLMAAERLRRRLARLEAGRRHGAEHGRLPDPGTDAAAEDAHDLAHRLARGETRLFRVGLYLAVHADTDTALAENVAAVRALAASLLLDARPASWRQLAGWTSCLPLGLDRLNLDRIMDTDAVAAGFPFSSPDLPPPDPASPRTSAGVLYGYNAASSGLVHWDRFAQDNYNSVILARSGAGKSYLVKLELLRSLYRGIEGFVLDPEGEYVRLTHAVGGVVLDLGAPGVHLNPLDLPLYRDRDGRLRAPADAYTQACLFTHTALAVLLGEPGPPERAIVDAAITATYRRAGITPDPATWARAAPLLADLADALRTTPDPTIVATSATGVVASSGEAPPGGVGAGLAGRLHPFLHGAYRGLLSGPTTLAPTGHLVTFNLRGLAEQVRPIGMLLVLAAIWRQVANPVARRPRLVVVDEAWTLLQRPDAAAWLARLARSGRRHWTGLTLATQDVDDVLGTELGRAVVTNAATQILLRQAPQTLDHVARVFGLSGGEQAFLQRATPGRGLLLGSRRVAFHAVAAETEHALITTDPRDTTHRADPDDDPDIELATK